MGGEEEEFVVLEGDGFDIVIFFVAVFFEFADGGHLLTDEFFVGGDDFVDELVIGGAECSAGAIGF